MLAGAGGSSLPSAEEGVGRGQGAFQDRALLTMGGFTLMLLPPRFSGLNELRRLQVGQSNVAHYLWSKVKCQSRGGTYFS